MKTISGDKQLRRGFGGLQMMYWCAYGSFTTYIVSYVTAERGASASTAGLVMALFMLCACAGQFALNAVCDRFQNNRKIFMGGMAAVLALYYAVYFAPSLPLMMVLYALLGFLQPALGSSLDTWLIRSFPEDPNAYSPIRALGSIAYSAVMLIMGYAIKGVGHGMMLILGTVFAVGGVALAWFMPEVPPLTHAMPGRGGKASLKTLQPVVWMFVASMAILGIANMPLLNMNLMILEHVGGDVSHTGVATCFNTIGEFLVMGVGARLVNRISARRRLLLSAVFYLVSTALMLVGRSVPVMYLAFFINGLCYGTILPARRQMITETVPENLLNRMHGIGDMAYTNLGGLIGNQMGGLMIDWKGVPLMATVSIVLQAIGIGMICTFKRLMNGKSPAKGLDRSA